MDDTKKKHWIKKQLCIVTERNLSEQNTQLKINSKSRKHHSNPEEIIRCNSTMEQLKSDNIKSSVRVKKKSFCQFVNYNQTHPRGAKKKNRSMYASLIVSYDNKISPIHLRPKNQKRLSNDANFQCSKQKQLVSKPTMLRINRDRESHPRNNRAMNEWINQFKSSLRIKYTKKPLIPKQFRIRTEPSQHVQLGFECRPWTRRDKEEQWEGNIHNI